VREKSEIGESHVHLLKSVGAGAHLGSGTEVSAGPHDYMGMDTDPDYTMGKASGRSGLLRGALKKIEGDWGRAKVLGGITTSGRTP